MVVFTAGESQKEEEEEKEEDPMDAFYPQALAGFIMAMTEDGDVIYLTDNVSTHVGITQVQFSFSSVIHTDHSVSFMFPYLDFSPSF